MNTTTESTMNIGHKIERIRTLRGMKQETLASVLGVTQQAVSKLEKSDEIDDDRLEKIAQALEVSVDTIKNFDDQAAVNYFNTFNDNSLSNSNGAFSAFQCTFNPLEKLLEALEENKKLYERLLQTEKEKNALLESIINKK
jgi:transcriptional regulator with XRE-family HTH domain